MFCSKCGAPDQSPDAYCRTCGEWIIDPTALSRRNPFNPITREEQLTKIRTLQLVGAGLSITSATILLAFLFGNLDRGLLFVALACSIVVAVYQFADIYLGYKVGKTLPRPPEHQSFEEVPAELEPSPTTRRLQTHVSVVEGTTELLDREKSQTKRSGS